MNNNLSSGKIHRDLRLGRLGFRSNGSGFDEQLVDGRNLLVQLLKTCWDDGAGLNQSHVLGGCLLSISGRAGTGMAKLKNKYNFISRSFVYL